ncbi:surface lipoprotein assembly modifier [uncultured Tateyamaria sp.]|uniref:surface lipoprotein assembly modifier n=1 Tax=uncultured Tateyamaria sp. TaxID=455651 RepID=UPI002610CA30|nr:surface lipoprotein assembly modifier [uncultured Tateyamaria sp.]
MCAALALNLIPFTGHAENQLAQAEPKNAAHVTLDQARVLAYQALQRGHIEFAIKIARGLLDADPNDASAHFILAAAMAKSGDATAARKFAARAYRISDSRSDRAAAAQFAARASLIEERPTLTQLWLRRAAVHATDEVSQKRIAEDYQRVRQINPFSFRVGLGFRPSNNVNNGADSALQVIDGVPAVGVLSGSAQALDGNIGLFDLSLRYRLRRTDRSETSVGSQVYVRKVWLSSEAKAQAPDLENEDLGSTYLDNSVTHHFALGAKGNTASVGFGFGRAWSGGDERFDFLSLRGSRSIRLGDRTRLSLTASVEDRASAIHEILDETLFKLGTSVQYKRENGDSIGVSLGFTETASDFSNAASSSQSIRATYGFGKPLGPAKVSTSLTIGQADFDDYRVGFISVPDGRKDESVYADVTFFFSDWDYAGFAPSVRVRTGRRDSNISRFESREFSVDFQIRSSF